MCIKYACIVWQDVDYTARMSFSQVKTFNFNRHKKWSDAVDTVLQNTEILHITYRWLSDLLQYQVYQKNAYMNNYTELTVHGPWTASKTSHSCVYNNRAATYCQFNANSQDKVNVTHIMCKAYKSLCPWANKFKFYPLNCRVFKTELQNRNEICRILAAKFVALC